MYFMVKTAANSEGKIGFTFDVYDDSGLNSSRYTADDGEKAKVVFAKIVDNVPTIKVERKN